MPREYEQELEVPPFGRKDIQSVAQQADYYDDYTINLYYSDITLDGTNVIVSNENKAAILKSIYNRALNLKTINGYYEINRVVIESDPPLAGYLTGINVFFFVKTLLVYTIVNNNVVGVGVSVVGNDGTVYVGFLGYTDAEKAAIATALATDPTKCITLRFRIEK